MATFEDTKYEADDGSIHLIRLSSETLTQAGTPPIGDVDSEIKAKVSKGNREFGIRPRYVRGSAIVGTPPDDFRKYSSVPVLTPTDFASPAFALGGTFTIGGIVFTIIARFNEDY